jgi:hypothetical protein
MNHRKLSWLGLLFVLSLVSLSTSQQKPDLKATKVTISELGLHPEKYDRRLVSVNAWLVFGWEGDDFLSDPSPQNMPSGGPAYVWFYCKPDHEQKVYDVIAPDKRRKVRGSFVGYFHFVPNPQFDGVFSPGHFQLEVVEAPVLEPQPRSLADAIMQGDLEAVRRLSTWEQSSTFWMSIKNYRFLKRLRAIVQISLGNCSPTAQTRNYLCLTAVQHL